MAITLNKYKLFTCAFFLFLTSILNAQNVVLEHNNVVIAWNRATLNAISQARQVGTIPGRTLFLVHTAMFDAWAAYDHHALGTLNGGTLRQSSSQRTFDNKATAMSYAAFNTLNRIFVGATPQLAQFSGLMVSLGLDPTNTATNGTTPAGIGNLIANQLMNSRQNDGSNQLGNQVGTFWNGSALVPVPPQSAYGDYTGYVPVNPPTLYNNNGTFVANDPNRWQPIIPAGSTAPQIYSTPFWGLVTPFALTSANQFSIQGPYLYPSKDYIKQANHILKINAELTSTQKAIAEFWNAGTGSVSTFGLWNQAAQFISTRDSHTQDDDVKLFFILNNYSLDSQIAGYYQKRKFDSERPITAIRFIYNGKTIKGWAGPGLGTKKILGQNFKSYLTPPAAAEFPATFQGAFASGAAYILTRFTDNKVYGNTATVAKGSSTIEPGITPDENVVLSWVTYQEAVDQASQAALYAGIQFPRSIKQGAKLSKKVAKLDYQKSLFFINGK
jgi:hypothetical protein